MNKSLMGDKKLYGTATVGTKGQIVIPADAREELNIKPGDRMYVMNAMHGSGIVLLKEEMLESLVQQMTEHIESFRALSKDNNKE
ncbi:AbrB/MazE/SpoVT family DNA-binding domain-containing protein [Streptomyces caniscabiei]|uniref:AbrB/MazE/SpoVT family DNA-binding domain-containing protein n=1 Tax=Streptomyces caniscabiei TaxID=2746961 RepID=UPI0029A92C78|nr:AbrB/MazE/SpoVT family DNA-binding domain-containing protein [Streptomyces caniscabiei]MDX2776461.1 AbrB/MazE/SpoVT family DNA-binding domain-containing protein [Streptomyces caniscabiei]